MKNYIKLCGLLLILLGWAESGRTQVQPVLNHFYMHGWRQDANSMTALSNFIDGALVDFTSAPERHDYNGWSFIDASADAPNTALVNAHPEGRYIGMGYSAGGLITRSIVHKHGIRPANERGFVEGFVTLGTPNTGATIAHRWEGVIFKMAVAYGNIGRGEQSFLAYGSLAVYLSQATIWTPIGEAIRLFWPFTRDIMPGSDWFRDANGIHQPIENSLIRGKTVVFGEVTGRTYPAFSSTTPNDIGIDQNNYQTKINDARNNSNSHDRRANELNRGGWIRRAWNWPERTWNRMRAGDWNACANGYEEANDVWQWATADRGPSDCFISVQSQTGLPNNIARNRIPGQMNHKNEYQFDGNANGQYQGPPTVRAAMHNDLLVN